MMRRSETNWINLNPEWNHILRWLALLLWVLLVPQCAHKAAPPGGPVDRIAPEVVDPEDVEMLQDLVVAAVNEGLEQIDRTTAERMSAFTGGLGIDIPGLL